MSIFTIITIIYDKICCCFIRKNRNMAKKVTFKYNPISYSNMLKKRRITRYTN